MRTRTSLIAILITLSLVAVTVPIATATDAKHDRLVIGIRLTFSGLNAAGSFAACCTVNDAGKATANILSFTPTADDQATFKATNIYMGQNGTFEIQLEGVTGPLSSPRHIARAHWTVVSGTGAYASLHGDGRLTAITDETNGELTGVATGEADRT